jgi:hypothetical protein
MRHNQYIIKCLYFSSRSMEDGASDPDTEYCVGVMDTCSHGGAGVREVCEHTPPRCVGHTSCKVGVWSDDQLTKEIQPTSE